MIGKPGYSLGAEYPFHYIRYRDRWIVFHAGTMEVWHIVKRREPGYEWREQHEAACISRELNGIEGPDAETLNAIDQSP